MKSHTDDRDIYIALMVALPLFFLLLWAAMTSGFPVGLCWIYRTFGIYCPGCGGTRALLALAAGRPLRAFFYHPPAVLVLTALAVYLPVQTVCRVRKKPVPAWCRYRPRYLWLLLALLVGNCLLRNILSIGAGIRLD